MTGLNASSLSAESVRTWPLIGRTRELRLIASERTATAPGVVVLSPAGVGKSRLAREALAEAERDGALTAWVQATRSAASVPLGAFAGMIRSEVGSDNLFELLRESARAMADLARGRPLVVGVDDAQLLDPTSAALVLHLVSTATAFVVVTVRTGGEPCPDAIESLWKDAGAQRLDLSDLSREETEQLVEGMVGGPVEEGVRQWIWESSQGNAMYACELVRGALSKGALMLVDGLWRMPVRPRISSSLAELISVRMAEIGPEERGALELLALGEPLRLTELAELTGEQALAAAERRGLISVEAPAGGGVVRLAHPLYGEVIRASLPSLRAHSIRVQLARVVQARDSLHSEDSLRVARWLLDAGEPIPQTLLLDAADTANRSGDPELAGELCRQALDAGAGVTAALVLARSHSVRNQFEQAEAVLAAAESQIDTQSQAVEYLQQQIKVLYWGLQQGRELQELFTRAQRWWPDEAWRLRLAPLRLYVQSRGSPQARTKVIGESAELLRNEDLDSDGRRTVQFARLSALFYSGSGREAHQLAQRIRPSLPMRDAVDEGILRVACGASIETGAGLDELEDWAGAALPAAVKLGDDAAAGLAALALGYRRVLQGRFVDAGRWLAEAQLHQERHDPDGKLAMTFSLQAWVACSLGDPEGCEDALTRCRAGLRGERPLPFELAYLSCAEAWAMIATGDSSGARQILLDRAGELSDVPLGEARVLYEAMRAGAPAGEIAPRLSAISEACDAPLVSAEAAHARCLAARDGKALIETADELEEIGALLYAREAATQAAEVFLNAGRQDSARRAAARSRELLAEGQGGVLPWIEGLDGPAAELTARETQLVELAQHGLTNPQIAERLVLSVRTVESHLYRAMQKLGVSDRRQL